MDRTLEPMSEDEYRRLGHLFTKMVETEEWREYEKLLERCIVARESNALKPIHAVPIESEHPLDAASRVLAVESLKGAIIGFTVAKNLPHDIISTAAEIRREKENSDG